MARYFKHDLNFLGIRKIFFTISGILCAASVVALVVFGLNLGIEFVGGTSITFSDTGTISLEDMRTACADADIPDATIQETETGGTQGFLLRTNTTDPNEAATYAASISESLGLSADSYSVSVIGPDWGTTVLRSSLIAFLVGIGAIIAYMAIRFEWKMGLTAVLALFHDLLIIVGIYALFQIEVTPNVIAALLTIMGYSLYDTVVVFHRMNENAKNKMKCSFMSMANHSINQVFTRTINTTLTSIIPVLAMLFFGGETLKGFALAMSIGLITGSYSSIGIASPLYVMWKEREPAFAKLKKRYGYESHVTDNVIAGLETMDDVNEAEKIVEARHEAEAEAQSAEGAKAGSVSKSGASRQTGSAASGEEEDDAFAETTPGRGQSSGSDAGKAAAASGAKDTRGSGPVHRGKQSRAQRKKSASR